MSAQNDTLTLNNVELLNTASIIFALGEIQNVYDYGHCVVNAKININDDFGPLDPTDREHIFNNIDAFTQYIIDEYTEIIQELPETVVINVNTISFMDKEIATTMFRNNFSPRNIHTILQNRNIKCDFTLSYNIDIFEFYNGILPYDDNGQCAFGTPNHDIYRNVSAYAIYVNTPLTITDQNLVGYTSAIQQIQNIYFFIHSSVLATSVFTLNNLQPMYPFYIYEHLYAISKVVELPHTEQNAVLHHYFKLNFMFHYLLAFNNYAYEVLAEALQNENVISLIQNVVSTIDANYSTFDKKEKRLAKIIRRLLRRIKHKMSYDIASPEQASITPTKQQSKWKFIIYTHGNVVQHQYRVLPTDLYDKFHSINHVSCSNSVTFMMSTNLVKDCMDIIYGSAHYFAISPEDLRDLNLSVDFNNEKDLSRMGVLLAYHDINKGNSRVWFPVDNGLQGYALDDPVLYTPGRVEDIQKEIFKPYMYQTNIATLGAQDIIRMFKQWFTDNLSSIRKYDKRVSLKDIDIILYTCRPSEHETNVPTALGYNRSPEFIQTPTPTSVSGTPTSVSKSSTNSPNIKKHRSRQTHRSEKPGKPRKQTRSRKSTKKTQN